MGPREVSRDERPRARAALEWDPQRAVDRELVEVAGTHPRRFPKSTTVPITPIGLDHLQSFSNFVAKWYSGNVKNLGAGLRDVDKTIDDKMAQAGKGGGNTP